MPWTSPNIDNNHLETFLPLGNLLEIFDSKKGERYFDISKMEENVFNFEAS